MELSLSAMAEKMIENRILGEVRNLIREKASSLFLASVLPAAPRLEEGPSLRITAELRLAVQSVKIECTIRTGGAGKKKVLTLENEEQNISIATGFLLRRPGDLAKSETLKLNVDRLELSGSLGGIEFTKMMLGAGAAIHGIEIHAVLSGSGSGVWLQQTEEAENAQDPALS